MTAAAIDVDWIVSEVLRRLAQLPAGPNKQENNDQDGAASRQPQTVLPERVVSLATLSGQLAVGRRLLLRPGAVVTPAARDELNKWSMHVEYAADGQLAAGRGLYVATEEGEAGNLAHLVTAIEPTAEVAAAGSLESAIESAVSAIAAGRMTAVWTDRPAAATCLANRNGTVWAGHACDVLAIEEMASSMANEHADRR